MHDRFLVVDVSVWLLGSSLNEFGSRGTMLVALPEPDAVTRRIEQAWTQAVPLEVWLARRGARSPGGAHED